MSDLTLVALDKVPMPLCTFVCKMARERGIADLGIWDHELTQKSSANQVGWQPKVWQ